MAYTLNFSSSRARARTSVRSARIPGALSGLRRSQREERKIEGASLRERGTRKETEREREREVLGTGQRVCQRVERDRRQIDTDHLI